ncbi:MAG TPA: diguanylate cyclase, partial [Thermoanaerobaculia bacterium]|nr:diguanylate cyclase [Thermoanaerobaculia bacterium]
RALTRDLDEALADAVAESPLVLALFDLDGFKHYNDTFGHPAGDTLLVRLGANLAERMHAAVLRVACFAGGMRQLMALAEGQQQGVAMLLAPAVRD